MEVKSIENFLSRVIKKDYCHLIGSGTTGLILSLLSQRFPKGSEIIIPNITCLIVPLAISFVKLKPVFIDVKQDDYNIDASRIEEKVNKNTKAIIGVHTFGHTFNVDSVKNICDENNILFIEDFCQSLGAKNKGRMHGQLGDISFTSFNNKIINSHGGAIFTNNKKFSKEIVSLSKRIRNININTQPERIRSLFVDKYLSWFSKRRIYFYSIVKHIFNLWYTINNEKFVNNFNKLYCKNLIKEISTINKIKKKTIINAKIYRSLLKSKEFYHPNINTDLLWKYSILINNVNRNQLLKEINIMGYRHLLGTSYTPPLHYYWYPKQTYPISNIISNRIVNLPVYITHSISDNVKISEIIKCAVDRIK